MAADTPARDREPELAAIWTVALLRVEIEPRAAQPADRELFQLVPDGEDAQQLAGKLLPLVFRRGSVLELQGPLAGMAKPRATEIIAGWSAGVLSREGRIDGLVDTLGEAGR